MSRQKVLIGASDWLYTIAPDKIKPPSLNTVVTHRSQDFKRSSLFLEPSENNFYCFLLHSFFREKTRFCFYRNQVSNQVSFSFFFFFTQKKFPPLDAAIMLCKTWLQNHAELTLDRLTLGPSEAHGMIRIPNNYSTKDSKPHSRRPINR